MKRLQIAVLLAPLLAGCIQRSEAAGSVTFQVAPWITYGLAALAVVLLISGVLLLRWSKDWKTHFGPRLLGMCLVTLGPVGAGAGALAASGEWLTISEDRLEWRQGRGEPQEVEFADVHRAEFVVKDVTGHKGPPEQSVSLEFIFKDGSTLNVNPMLLRGEALDELLARLKRRNIPVAGDRRGL